MTQGLSVDVDESESRPGRVRSQLRRVLRPDLLHRIHDVSIPDTAPPEDIPRPSGSAQ
jgi:hypothetical protein